jgi:NADH dehydrogenase
VRHLLDSRPQLTICVLGGTGFVGTELITQLAKDGHWIRVPTRAIARNDALRVLDTVRLIRADVHDPNALTRLFAGADVVINLIGILNEHGRQTFRAVHANLAEKVVAAARTARVSRLLHMSSLAADPTTAPSQYLRSKGEAEARVRASPPTLGWTIFRSSVIFGPGDSLTNRFAGLLRLSGGFLPLARASARFAPVGVEDVAQAFRRAVTDRSTINQTYELCGPEVMTLEKLVRTTAAVAGIPCTIIRLPDFVAWMQAVVMNFLPGKPFSVDNYKSLTTDSVCREDGCARLGIQPQPMLAVLPTYLGIQSAPEQLDYFRRINDR